jgi:ATP-dependent Clp protease ATP-binding subunit ClpC
MFERYTEKARRTIFFARYEASQFGSPYIETEHLLLGLLREDKALTHRFLRGHSDIEEIRRQIDSATMKREKTSTSVDLPLSNEGKRVLAYSAEEAERLSHRHIGTEHLLLGLLREENSFAANILHERGVRISFVREALAQEARAEEGSAGTKRSELPSDFSTFLTKLALEQLLLPCIGREKEIQQVMQVFGRSSKNNVVLIGEHGVGKRTLAEGVAQRVADNMGPPFLLKKLFAAVDLATLVAAAQRSVRPKEFLDTAAAELTNWGANTIFVFDELHMLLASGDDGAQEIVLLLKSALLEGKVRCIALATPEDHREAIKKSPWLERCFRAVRVEPPSQEETLAILQGVKGRFETFHTVQYADEALKAAVVYSSRHVKNRSLPDKAIDLLDDAGACVKMKHAGSLPAELVEAHKRLREIVHQIENAIANHEFDKARIGSEEERRQRDVLNQLQTQYGEKIGRAVPVTVEDVEEALSRWTGMPVTLIRQEPAATDSGSHSSGRTKTTKKRKKKSS